jgi:hypothetical protein
VTITAALLRNAKRPADLFQVCSARGRRG